MKDQDQHRPSKSQQKRATLELQALSETIIGLSNGQLAKIPLPGEVLEAVLAARKLKSRGASLRQRKYVAKLMRSIDHAPIKAAVSELTVHHAREVSRFKTIETWRDRLLTRHDSAVDELLAQYSEADRQLLRSLIRRSKTEHERELPPKSSRELFRYLDSLIRYEAVDRSEASGNDLEYD